MLASLPVCFNVLAIELIFFPYWHPCFTHPPPQDKEERSKYRAKIFLGYTSNLISAGTRETFRYLAKNKMVGVCYSLNPRTQNDGPNPSSRKGGNAKLIVPPKQLIISDLAGRRHCDYGRRSGRGLHQMPREHLYGRLCDEGKGLLNIWSATVYPNSGVDTDVII